MHAFAFSASGVNVALAKLIKLSLSITKILPSTNLMSTSSNRSGNVSLSFFITSLTALLVLFAANLSSYQAKNALKDPEITNTGPHSVMLR